MRGGTRRNEPDAYPAAPNPDRHERERPALRPAQPGQRCVAHHAQGRAIAEGKVADDNMDGAIGALVMLLDQTNRMTTHPGTE